MNMGFVLKTAEISLRCQSGDNIVYSSVFRENLFCFAYFRDIIF